MEFGINWVARNDNVKDFNNMIVFAKSLGANGITVVCNKLSSSYHVDSALTLEDFELLSSIIRMEENERYVTIQNCNNILATFSYDMPASRLYGCPAGIISCTMSVDGQFIPCPHLYFKEQFTTIKSYWEDSKYLHELRAYKTERLEHCDTCIRADRCRFCRAICMDSHNDLSKGYKGCPIYKEK